MSKLVTSLCLALACLTLAAADASARIWKNHEAGVTIWYPRDWKLERQRDVHLIRNDEVGIIVRTVPASQIPELIEHVDRNLSSFVTDIELDGPPASHTLHGMDAVTLDATGKVGGKKVLVSLLVARTPTDKGLVVLVLIEPADARKYEAQIGRMLRSIRPAR